MKRASCGGVAWCACLQAGIVHSSWHGEDDEKALWTLQFQTGDFLDVSLITT